MHFSLVKTRIHTICPWDSPLITRMWQISADFFELKRIFSAKIRDDPIFQRHPRRIERWTIGKRLEFDKKFITVSKSMVIFGVSGVSDGEKPFRRDFFHSIPRSLFPVFS